MSEDADKPPSKPRRVFKALKLNALALVDEACVPGSDILVIKAKPKCGKGDGCKLPMGHDGQCSTAEPESDTSQSNDTGHENGGDEKPDPKEVRKRLEPLGALNDALAADEITPDEYVSKARELIAELEDETRDGEPVHKMAAAEAATIIAETAMTIAEMNAALEAANTAIKTVEARNTELETEVAKAKDAVKAAETARDEALEEVKKAKAAPAEEPSEEEVLKALPPSLRAMVQNAKDVVAKTEARETEALVERAVAKAKKIGVKDPDAVGKAMVDVRKAAPEAALVIDAALEQVAEIVTQSNVFKSLGYTAQDGGGASGEDPEVALQAKADDIRKAKPTLSKEEAYSEAIDQNPSLYNAYVAKRRNLNPGVAH